MYSFYWGFMGAASMKMGRLSEAPVKNPTRHRNDKETARAGNAGEPIDAVGER
jgi:hypothetical protein